MPTIHVYVRTWWRENPKWPDGLEPHPGRKNTLAYVQSEQVARDICRDYNEHNEPGRLYRKAEYEIGG